VRTDNWRVIKFYRPGRWSRAQILEEHRFLFDLTEAEIPAVAPILTKDGESLLCEDQSAILFALFPKKGGRNPDELDDEQCVRVGRLLAKLHAVGRRRVFKERLKLTPDVYGLNNLEFLLKSELLPEILREPYAQAVKNLCQMISPWFPQYAVQRLHGDCHKGNWLCNRDGFFMVDFDDVVEGPPVQDLWMLIPGRDKEAQRKLELILKGYEEFGSFDQSSLILIEPLRALRMIHYAAWIGRRWADPAFKQVFPYFGTLQYWKEQLADVHEQLELIQRGGFGAEDN
jgi:Ser/Thr protein kinase RdoA (MazF antagonist)